MLRKEGREAGGLLKLQCESDMEKHSMEGFQDSLPSLPQRSVGLRGSGPAAQDARKTSGTENAPKHAVTVQEVPGQHHTPSGPWTEAVNVMDTISFCTSVLRIYLAV